MLFRLLPLATLALCCASAQMKDFGNHKDPALFTRLPHYFLQNEDSVVVKEFEGREFLLASGSQTVEGRHSIYRYDWDESAGTPPGFLQIVRNYAEAARRIGGQVLVQDVRTATLRITRGGAETWVAVEAFNEGRNYSVDIIEKGAMRQDVVADAAALRQGLREAGHVEVSGLFFDFNKAELKPESEPAIRQVVALLAANPTLKVWVVGHTDYVGAVDANLALSSARAASVVKALVAKGIAAARLAPFGAGPYAPVAPNLNEEGRAKNRRVELVAQP